MPNPFLQLRKYRYSMENTTLEIDAVFDGYKYYILFGGNVIMFTELKDAVYMFSSLEKEEGHRKGSLGHLTLV